MASITLQNIVKEYGTGAKAVPVIHNLNAHINDGKKHLNFSAFFDYSPKRANAKLEAAADEVSEGEMPLPSYRLAHPEARLSPEQIQALTTWITSVRSRILSTIPENETP